MAAVIVGSMVLSVAIALGTTFFKNRFTPDECKSGLVNYIMGLCAITEAPSPAPRPIRYTYCPPAWSAPLWSMPCLWSSVVSC